MKRFSVLFGGMAVSLLAITPTYGQNRCDATQKGSLLVWPDINIRWNSVTGAVREDTFISLTNDLASAGVRVKLFFVNGDIPVPAFGPNQGSVEPGWNYYDQIIELTHDEPAYWSSYTGRDALGQVVTPFTALDPNGRLDPEGAGANDRRLRGFVIGFAINSVGNLLRHNHLVGSATVIDYGINDAQEYNAWRFKAQFATTLAGDTLLLNGLATGYDDCPSELLMEFYASGSTPFGPILSPATANSNVDTRLTIVPMIHNFTATRPAEAPPVFLHYDVWNQDEVKQTNLGRCMQCWDSALVSSYPVPNFFLRGNLGSNKGKARIQGQANSLCNRPEDPNASPPVPALNSYSMPILGVSEMRIFWGPDRAALTGTDLSTVGDRTDGSIQYVIQADPPEGNLPGRVSVSGVPSDTTPVSGKGSVPVKGR